MNRLGVIAAGLFLIAQGCRQAPEAVTDSPTGPPWFEDVTGKCRLSFTHDAGPIDTYFLPQSFGSGGAVLDFDGDGLLDVYLIHNGGPKGASNRLFQHKPGGTFHDVSAGSGLDVAGFGQGVAIGDVNNDGKPDILLTEYGATRLFINQGGGRFREVTRDAGIDNPHWATSAAFFDYDRDGWLDLVVVNYLDYDPSVRCVTAGKLDFCGPNFFRGTVARLYRNLGRPEGRFEDRTLEAGLNTALGKGLGVLCADFDDDGWPDILCANDMMVNHLWINRKNGTFKEEAQLRGVAHTGLGQTAANMGIAWADVDGNGLPDLFITHIAEETHTLWQQGPRGMFQDRTVAAGLTAGWRSTGFGTAFVDFDGDGWPDAVWVNGGVVRNRGADPNAPFWSRYAQRNQLFANAGNGKFNDISQNTPALCGTPVVGRGLIVADLDNDGAPDLITTEIAGPARVFRNVAPNRGHWLAVRALLPQHKRDAYGAEVTVRAGGKPFWRLLNPGYSYCGSNDPRGHFGLGAEARYDSIDVRWPDGAEEVFPGGPADTQVELRQGEGKAAKK